MRFRVFVSMCLAVVGLAACGGSSHSTSSTTAAAGGSGPFSAARVQARVDLAKCLRAHGVDVPDSVGTGGPAAQAALQQLVAKYGLQGLVQKAQTYCKSSLDAAFPALNLNPAQVAQRRQQVLKFVECLRSHGLTNLPDPTNSGTFGAGLARALTSVNQNSPVFKAAVTACQSERPKAIG